MNSKRTPAKTYLLFAVAALLVIASISTFTYAQEEGEQQQQQQPASIETQQVEPVEPVVEQPVEVQPTVEIPVEQPVEVQPTVEIPAGQPIEVLPTVELPVEQPIEVLPTVEMVLPTQVIEPVLAQPVNVPFNDSFGSNQGWTASGTFVYSNGAQGETTWYADTSARAPESILEFNSPIAVRGLNQPQMVLRQRGTLSNTDIVLVEVQREGASDWTPLDQQAGPTVSGDWSARFIDLSSVNGQTIRLRIHVMAFGPVPAGETSTGYAIDELAIREYQAPPATVAPALPTAAPILPTTAPVIPTTAPTTVLPTTQPQMMQQLSVVQPQAVQVASAGTGLTGQYFDQKDLTNLRATRVDPTVNFYWHSGSPATGIAPNTFSARWTGKIVPLYSETYTFYTVSDDGVRLWVNGQRIINNWADHGPTEDRGTITLQAGQPYNIRLEYYEGNASATMTLWWSSRSQAKEIIPQSALFPANATVPTVAPTTVAPTATTVAPTATTVPPTATTVQPTATTVPPTTAPTTGNGTGLRGEYFSTSTLSNLFTTRTDATVNFSWDNEPMSGMAADYFSARWTGKVQPRYSETYTFYTYSDDGVRLWVNGQKLIDNWTNHGPTEDSGTITLQAGQKYDIVMEYYEGNVYATARLSWSSSSQAKEIIPQTQLYPATAPAPTTAPTTVAPTATTVPPTATTVPPTATTVPPTATTVVPTTAPTTGNGTGLRGEYFSTSTLSNLFTTRTDATVNFSWDNEPMSGMAADYFSARWTGKVQPRYSETYTFYTYSDDGVRLWVNGQKLIDNWTNHGPTEDSGTITLQAGQKYDIVMEYYEGNVYATARLSWSSNSQAKEIIPQTQLYPATAPAPTTAPTTVAPTATSVAPTATTVAPTAAPVGNGTGTGLVGEYYDNVDFTNLRVTRTDGTVNFAWDNEPAVGIDGESFSVRWTGKVQPRYSETYTFYTYSDDGVRLWVNGQQIINNWTAHGPTEDSGTITLQAGQKYDIRMDFFEGNMFATAKLSWSSSSQAKQIVPRTQLYPEAIAPIVQPTNTPDPGGSNLPVVNIPAPPALPPATGNVIALWDWSDPNIRIYPSPSGAPELGPVSSNDTAADGQGAYTRIVQTANGDRVVEFMANHDYVQRSYGTAARLFIRNWGYLQPYYGRIIQTDFYMRLPSLPNVPANNPNLVYGLGQQFKHADGVIWAMDAELAPDGSGVSPYVWWPRGSGVVKPRVPFEYQAGVWHRVQVKSLLHNTNGWAEVYVDGQLLFRINGNVSELWGGGIGLDLYIRDIAGPQIVHFSDWRLQVLN